MSLIPPYLGFSGSSEALMQILKRQARPPWLNVSWAAGVILVASCSEQHEPRASPIVARRLGGDSIAPGALIKVCKPEDEGCVPTYPVACSMTWMGDPAQKPDIPRLSPEAQAWCAAQGAAGSATP
jgi:hypothetical protein